MRCSSKKNAAAADRIIISMKELAKAIQHFDKDIVIGGGRHDYCMKLKNNIHTYFNKKSVQTYFISS
jgi:hypothetical protein